MRPRLRHCLLLTAALVAAGCSSGDDATVVEGDDATSTTSSSVPSDDTIDVDTTDDGTTDDQTDDAVVPPSGPAPGVSDEAIKIGITYVDTAALVAVGLDYDLGDHRSVYQALIDDINDSGGVHGRLIEPVYAAINPTDAEAADQLCLELTEDTDVFLVTGFFLLDAVLCPVDLHETAVVGGAQTPERVALAKAPWLTWAPDTDQPRAVLRALSEQGALDGSVAVYAAADDEAELENTVLPMLTELGVTPGATGLMDAPIGDTAAIAAKVQLLAERFESDGADTIVLVGASGSTFPQYVVGDSAYRPRLLFLSSVAVKAFATTATTTDTSILDGALAGGSYGPDQARFEEEAMQACIAILAAAGVDTPDPSGFDTDDASNQPYQAAFQACPDMVITRALLEAAGETLNYATLELALDGLVVHVPGDPTPRTFGPPPAGDGDPVAYLFHWDSNLQDLVLDAG